MIGSFTEEAISPIPSFVVMIPAGAAAHVQGVGWWYLTVLAILAACGRIVAAVLLYLIADKGEDLMFGHGRRFFGISHQQLERFGRRLSKSNRSWLGLFLLNAVPVLPTSMVSLACGFIKIDLREFVTATFLGTAINALCYMSIGYAGIQIASALRHLELAFQIVTVLVLVVLIGWLVRYRQKRHSQAVSVRK